MSTSLENRIAELERKHAGPVRIWVTVGDSGIYRSNGEALSKAELDARYAGEDVTVFRVTYDGAPCADENILEKDR